MTRLVVLGDLNLDVHLRLEDRVLPGDELRRPVRVAPGGSAGTFARTAAALGAEVRFVGAVGNDLVGDLLERSLTDTGVIPILQRVPQPSGVVVALHSTSDRSMLCSRGANDGLDPRRITGEVFQAADHLHVSGYAFLSDAQREAARTAISYARTAGISISVDPPPAGLIRRFGADRFLRELREVSWIFPNESEAALLSGGERPSEALSSLASLFEAGAVTLGRRGAIAWRGDERTTAQIDSPLELDPTGAGDAFAAAFTVGLLAGHSLSEAAKSACDVARQHLLSRFGLDSRDGSH
jgi:ribokinase